MAANPKYTYTHVTTATGQVIKPNVGTLAAVCVNKALSGTVTLKDGNTTIAVFTNGTTAPLGSVLFGGAGGIQFGSLNVSLSAVEDITICWE
jgi:hypothetical protein